MKCLVCGNEDSKLFNYTNGKYQCRRCLSYRYPSITHKISKSSNAHYSLPYELTKAQKEVSVNLLNNIKENKNVLVNAVCGAGKTEIIYDSIIWAINSNKRVGIAIPRKDVVEELYQRIKNDFHNISIVRVYRGETEYIDGDLIIFTTHQGSRYIGCFDLLFIDEVDAFPFSNNKVLQDIIERTCVGTFVYLSATKEKIKNATTLTLNKRYHGYDIPIPKVIVSYQPFNELITLLKKLLTHKFVVIFVASIYQGNKLYNLLYPIYRNQLCYINSTSKDRSKLNKEIKTGLFKLIIATTVYERGITLKDAQIIVYEANNSVFNVPTLLQIVGRAGRSKEYPIGEVYFISKGKCNKFKKVINKIKKYNE